MNKETSMSLRGFAILLVILGHIKSPFIEIIYSFHMPLFFFLAGMYIIKDVDFKIYIVKSFKNLILPFFAFSLIGIATTVSKNYILQRDNESVMTILSGLLYWTDPEHMHHYGFVLWFLAALFWGRIIVKALINNSNIKPIYLIILSFFISWCAFRIIFLPLGLDKGLASLPWIIAGYYYNSYRFILINNYKISYLIILLALILMIYNLGFLSLDIANKKIENYLSYPYSILVILLILITFEKIIIYNKNFLSYFLYLFGSESLIVMVLHVYTNNLSDIMIGMIFKNQLWFLTLLISIIMILFFLYFLKKFKKLYKLPN